MIPTDADAPVGAGKLAAVAAAATADRIAEGAPEPLARAEVELVLAAVVSGLEGTPRALEEAMSRYLAAGGTELEADELVGAVVERFDSARLNQLEFPKSGFFPSASTSSRCQGGSVAG